MPNGVDFPAAGGTGRAKLLLSHIPAARAAPIPAAPRKRWQSLTARTSVRWLGRSLAIPSLHPSVPGFQRTTTPLATCPREHDRFLPRTALTERDGSLTTRPGISCQADGAGLTGRKRSSNQGAAKASVTCFQPRITRNTLFTPPTFFVYFASFVVPHPVMSRNLLLVRQRSVSTVVTPSHGQHMRRPHPLNVVKL